MFEKKVVELCAYCGYPKYDTQDCDCEYKTYNLIPCPRCKEAMNKGYTFVYLNKNDEIEKFIVVPEEGAFEYIDSFNMSKKTKESLKKSLRDHKIAFCRVDETLKDDDKDTIQKGVKVKLN